jgi:hypothetical protein
MLPCQIKAEFRANKALSEGPKLQHAREVSGNAAAGARSMNPVDPQVYSSVT